MPSDQDQEVSDQIQDQEAMLVELHVVEQEAMLVDIVEDIAVVLVELEGVGVGGGGIEQRHGRFVALAAAARGWARRRLRGAAGVNQTAVREKG